MVYQLSIHKLEQNCLFELTSAGGRRVVASLPYPNSLTAAYQFWHRAYLRYYRQDLRGRVAAAGQFAAKNIDYHGQLVQAEARLLSEFHKWLRHEALFELRTELVKGSQTPSTHRDWPHPASKELFLTCSSPDLDRLPWETWEMGADVGQQGQIHIVRSPSTIRSTPVHRQSPHRRKTRVLAILGDERGLNFDGDRAALTVQKKLLDVHYVGWQPGENIAELRERISQTIADPQGWDILFFAGHSNEAAWVDGQIAIAPNTFMTMRELTPYLTKAKQHGLQFALFNSCSGLDIANRLIDLGLSQVAIMREPIHNKVAQEFLVQFLQRLAQFEDVEASLMGACRFLKLEKSVTYPSTYLVPSLFRHPQSVPYSIPRRGWRTLLRKWRPNRREAVAVGALALVSLLLPVQHWLLNQRLGIQARYRDGTAQLISGDWSVLLVQIDDRTLQERSIAEPNPIDRALLADIVTTLTHLEASVISLDYLLDRPQPEADPTLNQAFQQAAAQQTWIVLATKGGYQSGQLSVTDSLASPNWSLGGNIESPLWYIPPRSWSSTRPVPFSYQTAIAYQLSQRRSHSSHSAVPSPDVNRSQPLQKAIIDYTNSLAPQTPLLPRRAILHPITNQAYQIEQHWLQPLIDFSLPPDRVYHRVSAWDLLTEPEQLLADLSLTSLQNLVVIVAPGGYDEAGFSQGGEDNLDPPIAIAYWHQQSGDTDAPKGFTGGEIHAYLTHQLLHHHLVVPLPDAWMIILAALLGKGLALKLAMVQARPLQLGLIWAGATLVYGVVSLQLYVSGQVMLPWLLPSLTFCFYGIQLIRERNRDGAKAAPNVSG
ncbi:MAG: CHASE2 domain-containing protein [Leptolyngbyaceae cyanobacterium]